MEMRAEKSILRMMIISLAVIAVSLFASFLFGCADSVNVSFSVDGLTLYIGDSRDIYPYIIFDPAVTDDKFVSVSVDGDCVETEGTILRAVKKGSATVTAVSSGGSATMEVTCIYRPAGRISVSADNAVQSAAAAADIAPVVFTAELDDYVDPDTQVVWSVNGADTAVGYTFDFSPPSFGKYTVSASVGSVRASAVASVYRATAAHIAAYGETSQEKNYSPVVFYAREDIDTRNPDSVYEWTLNGETVGTAMFYEFIPTAAGEYEIGLKLNGVSRKFENNDFATVSVTGERAPTGEVVFDDTDGVKIVWSDKQNVSSVTIASPDGSRRIFNRADIAHAYRFYAGYFDASGLIETCSNTPAEYTVRLAADGQGDEFTFTQLPLAAKQYLDTKVLCYNNFLAGATDVDLWIRELYACGEKSGDGYNATLTNEALIEVAEHTASALGLELTFGFDGNVVHVDLGEYINSPSTPVAADLRYTYSELPHIEYDRARLRYRSDKNSYKLAIERLSRTVAVENTEQLLLVSMNGARPTFTQGSSVAASFAQAKDLLVSIIGYDYNDFEKVHAIYDVVQWMTRRTSGDRSKTCNYIEAYFTGTMELSEGYTQGAATSEGAAKTFALLCAMEGIRCDIIGVGNDGGGIYYSNAVNIGGATYNVDVYGSKASDGGAELGSHSGLFTADEVVTDSVYCAFDAGKTFYTRKSYYGSVYYDRYIAPEETDYSSVKAVIFGTFGERARGEVTIPLVGSTVTVANTSFGTEIMLDKAVVEDDTALQLVLSNIEKAVKEYLVALGAQQDRLVYRIRRFGRVVHVTASVPVATPAA